MVELTSIEQISPIHQAQLLTVWRLAEEKVGALIHFNVAVLNHGIVRRVL
jgi:hypothetical protein